MKKIFTTIFMFFYINAILFFPHFIAIMGVGFNDNSTSYSNFFDFLPQLLMCLTPLIAGSVLVIKILTKKEEFYKTPVWVFQIAIIIMWIIIYIDAYMKV